MKAPVDYIPNLLNKKQAYIILEELKSNLDWERREGVPRYEYYCNDYDFPYSYGMGRGVREYKVRPYHPHIYEIRKLLEEKYACVFDVCFLNLYEHSRDYLGWHADDSLEMDNDRPIATVSIGGERPIQFKRQKVNGEDSPFKPEELLLEHGSAAVMLPGMQLEWYHRIPKVGYVVEPRISLTFRGFNKEFLNAI